MEACTSPPNQPLTSSLYSYVWSHVELGKCVGCLGKAGQGKPGTFNQIDLVLKKVFSELPRVSRLRDAIQNSKLYFNCLAVSL